MADNNLVQLVKGFGDHHYEIGSDFFGGNEPKVRAVHTYSAGDCGMKAILSKWEEKQDTPGNRKSIAIAYGGFMGLTMAASRNLAGALLVDINPAQKKFWKALIELIKQSPNKEVFNERVACLDDDFYTRGSLKAPTPNKDEVLFFNDDVLYRRVRKWAMSGMVAATDMDASDTSRHKQLAEHLKDSNYKVDMIYLSNIPHFYKEGRTTGRNFYDQWLEEKTDKHIYENQAIIGNNRTRIIEGQFTPKSKGFRLKDVALSSIKDITK